MAIWGRRAVIQVEDRRIESLRVRFDVARTLSGRPSSAEVRVWNLAEASRRTLADRRDVGVLVLAGYRDEAPHLVFSGRLRRLRVSVEGGDVVTTISGGDGVPRVAPVGRSLAAGSDVGAALGAVVDAAQAVGIGAGNSREVARSLRGRRVAGAGLLLSDVPSSLDALLADLGIEWSVQDGQLQLLERGRARQTTAVVLASGSALIGSPQVEDRGRLRATSRIVPGIAPGSLVRVESLVASGFYRVESGRWLGDTEGQEWQVELDLAPRPAS